jgi:hypothetical protein
MKTIREFVPADRYVYDFGPCSSKNGFAQIDTKQDASYFGTWCSPSKRAVVSYCEGDVTTQICASDEEFVGLLREIARWNDEQGHGPARIDPGFAPELKEAFVAIGLGDMLH